MISSLSSGQDCRCHVLHMVVVLGELVDVWDLLRAVLATLQVPQA